jgi:DNA polymerase/3'-5' exonuclease PolX
MKLEIAKVLAHDLLKELRPYCSKGEIAGGIRRGKAEPHDIELVLQPREEQAFGYLNPVDQAMHELVADGEVQLGDPHIQVRRDPETGQEREITCKAPFSEKYYRVKYRSQKVDVFVVTPPAEWGTAFLIRTGDGGHNIWMVKQGWSRGIYFRDLRLVQHVDSQGRYIPKGVDLGEGARTFSLVIPTPEEEDVFKALRLPWKDPKERVMWAPAGVKEWEEAALA